MLDWIITCAVLAASLGMIVLGNWKAGQPWDDLKPPRVPWRFVMILSMFVLVLAAVHLVNLFGVETGPDKSPFGRF